MTGRFAHERKGKEGTVSADVRWESSMILNSGIQLQAPILKPSISWENGLVSETISKLGATAKRQAELRLSIMAELNEKLSLVAEGVLYDNQACLPYKLRGAYEEMDQLKVHILPINCMQVLADQSLVTCDNADLVTVSRRTVVNMRVDWAQESFKTNGRINCLQVTPDRRILTASQDSLAQIWTRTAEGWKSEELAGHDVACSAVRALPDGRILTADVAGNVFVWKRKGFSWEHKEILKHFNICEQLRSLSDGSIVVGVESEIVILKDMNDGEVQVTRVPVNYAVRAMQVLPDDRIVVNGEPGTMCIYKKQEDGSWLGESINASPLLRRAVNQFQVLQGDKIISGGDDGIIRLWMRNAEGEWTQSKLHWEDRSVKGLQVLPCGRIVAGFSDGQIVFLDGKD